MDDEDEIGWLVRERRNVYTIMTRYALRRVGAAAATIVLALLAGLVWKSNRPVTAPSLTVPQSLERESLSVVADARDTPQSGHAPAPCADAAPPGISVSGTVTYQKSGDPVLRARVSAAELMASSEVHTFTDAKGAYMLTGLKPTEYLIQVESPREGYMMISEPGFADRIGLDRPYRRLRLSDGETRTGLNIVLASGGAVSGKVIDKTVSYDISKLSALLRMPPGADRKREGEAFREFMREAEGPKSGVRILLVEAGGTAPRRVLQETVSDETGRYVLTDCPAGKYAIEAEPPAGAVIMSETHSSRYRPVDIPPAKDVNDVDFSFRLDSVSVIGRVTDSGGKPIQGVRLSAELPGRDRGDGSSAPPDEGKVEAATNEDGVYRLSGLLPAHILHAVGFVWSADESAGYDYGYRLRARASGYAAAQVAVPPVPESLAKAAMAFIDEATRLRLPEVSNRPAPRTLGSHFQYCAGDAIRVDIALTREATVCGRLVDTRGKALAKASVRMTYAEANQEKPRLLAIQKVIPEAVTAGDAGAFEITAIPAGHYVFQAVIEKVGTLHARNAPLELRAGDAIRELELIVESPAERGDITGTVSDASTNRPVPTFSVAVSKVDSPSEPHPRHGDLTVEEAKNVFFIRGVSPGVATLLLSAPGYPATEVQARVESGKTSTVLGHLAPEGVIEGAMTLNGAPVSGRVSVRLADGRPILESGGGAVSSRTVDATPEGTFSIPGLSPGAYLVRADATASPGPPAAYRHHWTSAHVGAGHVTRLNVNVEGFAAIRGNFTFPEIYKYGWIQVYEGHVPAFSPMEDEEAAWRLVRATADLSGQSGPYEITNLSPGTYTVIAFCFGRKGKTGAEYEQDRHHVSHLVTVGDGEELELNLEIETPP